MMMVMAVAGCENQGGSGTRADGAEFLGEWQKSDSDCPACVKWIFTRTKEGGIKAEKLKTYDLQYPYRKLSYATSYDAKESKIILHGGFDVKAGINNGELVVLGETFHRMEGR